MSAQSAPILAVDDNEEDLELIGGALQREGYAVRLANTGERALKALSEHPSQVLLVDLALPDMSGLHVLKAAQRKDPNTTGIVLTASNSEDAAIRSMREGAFDFLVKPCAWPLLSASVSRALHNYRIQNALGQVRDDWSQSLADMTHEIKNPLTVISGYSSFLMSKLPELDLPKRLENGLKAINVNAIQLQALVEDLMEMVRLNNNKIELRAESIPVADFLSQTSASFSLRAEQKGISLLFACEGEGSLRVNADAMRLGQILGNLLSNALKFTPRGGSISLSALRDGAWIRFCVSDTGIGIPAKECARIFERYYQAQPSLPSSGGIGLGLEICRRMVELHGGKIWVESVEGRGSSFFFTLPATSALPDASRFTSPPNTAIRRR